MRRGTRHGKLFLQTSRPLGTKLEDYDSLFMGMAFCCLFVFIGTLLYMRTRKSVTRTVNLADSFCVLVLMHMQALNLVTVVSIGLMIGVELSVSIFINPIIRRLSVETQAHILPMFAKRLGAAMPFWYIANLILLIVEAILHRGMSDFRFFIIAASIWIFVILITVAVLVPINNRIAKLDPLTTPDWQAQHRRWDILHHLRVVLLIVAFLIAL